jgi:hypothetical protein
MQDFFDKNFEELYKILQKFLKSPKYSTAEKKQAVKDFMEVYMMYNELDNLNADELPTSKSFN